MGKIHKKLSDTGRVLRKQEKNLLKKNDKAIDFTHTV